MDYASTWEKSSRFPSTPCQIEELTTDLKNKLHDLIGHQSLLQPTANKPINDCCLYASGMRASKRVRGAF